MSDDLRSLYQEVILDHYRNPRHFGALDGRVRRVEGYNPLCGDQVTIYVRTDGERIEEIAFEGEGCAISTASASMMAEATSGLTVAETERLQELFHELLTGDGEEENEGDGLLDGELGQLEVLRGVRAYPMRVKCATLAWHALKAALAGDDQEVDGGVVSTE